MSTATLQRKKTVMIADDNQGILDVMRVILENKDYIVVTTNDGRDVLKMKAPLPDLLFLDLMLSGTDGRDLCRELKSNKKSRDLPILMLSANSELEAISEACGADGYLSKPFDMNDMLDLVDFHITKRTK